MVCLHVLGGVLTPRAVLCCDSVVLVLPNGPEIMAVFEAQVSSLQLYHFCMGFG